MNYLIGILLTVSLFGEEWLDLESYAQSFVIEAKQIQIPGFPVAFNPSIVPFHGNYLMSFRNIPDRKNRYTTYMGVILLDRDFNPISAPQILATRTSDSLIPNRAEDGRLLWLGDRLYLIYDDNVDMKISKGGFRLYIGEIRWDGSEFTLTSIDKITQYEGADPMTREKAWTPFDYQGNLLLAYSIVPHKVFSPLLGKGFAKTVAETNGEVNWPWGILRGGTPALQGLAPNEEYLSFFHSCIKMESIHSDGKSVLHYFIGAYTFSPEPPFALTHISPFPVIGKKFYHGPIYEPYWHPVRVVFPAGYVFDENYIYLFYGRQDHEIWVAKLDKKEFLKTLIPLH